MDALAAAGDWHGVESDVLEHLARELGDLGALGQPGAGARVEVEHEPVGILRVPRG